MDEPSFTEHHGYHIARHNPSSRRGMSVFSSRVSLGALILTLILASVALFSVKHITFHNPAYMRLPNRSHGLHSLSNPFRFHGESNVNLPTSWNGRDSNARPPYVIEPPQLHYRLPHDTLHSRSPSFPIALRPKAACTAVEDFVQSKEVMTWDCRGGRGCRARVVITKTGGSLTIQAGYYIFYSRGVIEIDPLTKRNVNAVKKFEADRWARRLLLMIRLILKDFECDVTAEMISEAIMETKNDAAQCPKTDDPLCTELKTINTCTVFEPLPPETNEEKECREFLKSDTSISSYDDLSTKSRCDLRFHYSWVFMKVPLCTKTCTIGKCSQEKLVFAELWLTAGVREFNDDETDYSRPRDAIATIILPVYKTLIASNIPSCDSMPYGLSRDSLKLNVATMLPLHNIDKYLYQFSEDIQDVAAQNEAYIYSAQYKLPMKVEEYLESQCI